MKKRLAGWRFLYTECTMKQKQTLARVATVVSSLVLVGAYVTYRALWTRKPEPQGESVPADSHPPESVLSGSKREAIFTPERDAPKKVMGGSKSLILLNPSDVKGPDAPATETPKVQPEGETPTNQDPTNKKPESDQPPTKPAEKPNQ